MDRWFTLFDLMARAHPAACRVPVGLLLTASSLVLRGYATQIGVTGEYQLTKRGLLVRVSLMINAGRGADTKAQTGAETGPGAGIGAVAVPGPSC